MDLKSVLIYLFVFTISVFFAFVGEKGVKGRLALNGRLNASSKVWITLSILPPCILAALRSNTVGFDFGTYIYNNFQYAIECKSGFLSFWHTMPMQVEILFAALIYLFAKAQALPALMFVIELLCLLPLYVAIIKQKNKMSLAFSLCIYYFLFYNFTLSGMRQGIAMSFLLLAYVCFENKETKKTIITLIIAALFHLSTLLILAFFILAYRIGKSKHYALSSILLFCVLLSALVLISKLSPFIARLAGSISGRYAFYIQEYISGTINLSDIPATDIIIKTLLVLGTGVALIMTGKLNQRNDKALFLMVLLGRYFVLFNSVFYESMRIAFYFDLFIVIFIPKVLKAFRSNAISKIGIAGASIVCASFYWLYFIMHIGAYGTAIYTLL